MRNVTSILLLLITGLTAFAQPGTQTLQICPGESAVLRANPASSAEASGGYIWFRDGVMLGSLSDQDSLIVSDPGTYAVVSLNEGGCESDISDPVVVEDKQLVAVDDYFEAGLTQPVHLAILTNDLEGCEPIDPAAVQLITSATQGTLQASVTGGFTYTPNGSFTGIDSFTYTISDQSGNTCNIAYVYITVTGAPLAVRLLFFKAEKQGSSALLSWRTANEDGNPQFVIERGPDGYNFDSIGVVRLQGRPSPTQDYQFTDRQPLTGNNFYRLRILDADGTTDYSEVRLLNFAGLSEIQIYPNPVSSMLYIKTGTEIQERIQVLDLQGRILQDFEPESPVVTLDLSAYAVGAYLINVRTKDNRWLSYKISKM